MLKMVPIDTDGEMLPQLVASLERLYTGVSDIGESVAAVLDGPARPLRVTVDGPEPRWLVDLRARYRDTVNLRASVVVVPRESIAAVLSLIDDARKR